MQRNIETRIIGLIGDGVGQSHGYTAYSFFWRRAQSKIKRSLASSQNKRVPSTEEVRYCLYLHGKNHDGRSNRTGSGSRRGNVSGEIGRRGCEREYGRGGRKGGGGALSNTNFGRGGLGRGQGGGWLAKVSSGKRIASDRRHGESKF